MELKMEVYSPGLVLLGLLEQYRSLIYEDKAFSAGSFSVEALLTEETLVLLKPENILWIEGETAGIIEYLQEQAGTDGPYMTVKGRLLTGILDRRILWGRYELTGTAPAIMRKLVQDCAVSPTRGDDTEARRIPGLALEEALGPASRLPEGYTELEYIESSGTQYIDTGFVPNQDTKVVALAETLNAIADAGGAGAFVAFGAATTYNANAFECYSGFNAYMFTYDGQYNSIGQIAKNQKVLIALDKNISSVKIGDNEVISHTFEKRPFTSPFSLTLFASHRAEMFFGENRIYSCQIYDNGTLARDYIPCKDPSGSVGLYDLAGNTFYGNAGTGAFTAGPSAELPSRAAADEGTAIRTQKTGGTLLEALEELGEAYGVAFGVRFNAEIPQMEFWTRRGADRSVSQSGNEPVFYSTELDDVLSSEYSYDSTGYRNITLVAGEGEGADRVYATVTGETSDTSVIPPDPTPPPAPPTHTPTKYTITLNVDPDGGGTASGGGTVEDGKSVTVTATPADGYTFVEWRENGQAISTDLAYTFTAEGNRELVAVFKVKSRLPEGYTEVEYILTNTNFGIDTGVKISSNTSRLAMDIEYQSGNADYFIFSTYGTNVSGLGWRYFSVMAYQTSYFAYRDNSSSFGTITALKSGERGIIDFDFRNRSIAVGSAKKAINSGSYSYTNNTYLGKAGSGDKTATFKLYSAQIYNGDILQRDFIPCTNPSAIVGLYDLIEGKFYSNAWSGAPVAGPAV